MNYRTTKGTKFIIGDEKCGYGVYIALKDIDLEGCVYDFDGENYFSLAGLIDIGEAEHAIDVLRSEGYIKPDEQFPYLNLRNENVILENFYNY